MRRSSDFEDAHSDGNSSSPDSPFASAPPSPRAASDDDSADEAISAGDLSASAGLPPAAVRLKSLRTSPPESSGEAATESAAVVPLETARALSPTSYADRTTLEPKELYVIAVGIVVPCLVILGVYSAMGKGIAVYSSLSREGNYAIAWFLAIAAVFWLACLWIVDAFDPSITDVSARRAVKVLTAIPLAMLFVASMLAVEEYVSAPMVLFIVFKALLDKTLFDLVCPAGAASAFMVAVGYGNVAVSVAVILGWCVWMWAFDKEWSNREMFDLYHERLDCDRTSDTLEVGRCQAAYLIWGAPLIVGLLCFFFGLACLYLAKEGSAVRMLMIQFLILGMGMWVSMSISGAEMGLADDLLQFALLFCSMMIVVCVNMIGYDNIKTKIGSMRMASKIGEYSQSNFAKAMLIVLTMPLIPLFMLLSAAIRQSRRLGLSMAPQKAKRDAEVDSYLTFAGHGMLRWLFSDVTAVMTWAAYIAMFYFICDVGVGKGATLFLGWMISVMKELSPAVVLVAFVALGVSMFLLPPVPGPPVYLTGGVLLVGSMEESMGFWGATALCILVCWVTKLISCAMQQKLFGENMSENVSVRYAVGINSLQMRAIRYCLMQPGLSPAKVAILCGGPDWPTSVLCGILRVPLHEAMIGTSPVLVLYLAYTALAGAFTLKTGGECASDATRAAPAADAPSPPPPAPFPPPAAFEEPGETNYWQMGSAVALGVAMVSMSCTSFAAVYYMEDTIANKRKECDAFPVDEEVEAREKKVAARQEAYKKVTKWTHLPALDRTFLGAGVVLMTAGCQIAGNFGSRCFAAFTVTCTVRLVDVVKNLGWVAIVLFGSGLVCFQLYQRGASARTKRVMEEEAEHGVQPNDAEAANAAPSFADEPDKK